jgi:hypothetical protein
MQHRPSAIPQVERSLENAMRLKLLAVAFTAAAWVGASLPASAHHAFAAEYDAEKPFDIAGTLTKVEWVNPHSWIYVDVKTPDGKVTNWQFEFGAPNALVRRGVHKSDLPIGLEVHVKGYLAKSGQPVGNATSVTLPDGRNLYTGSSGTGTPGEPPP